MIPLNKISLLIILLSLSNFVFSQTQIGEDIDGLLPGVNFGHNVSLSANGQILAACGFGGSSDGGRLRVFKNINDEWTLYGVDENGENFGGMGAFSLALSADGNTLAAGRWENSVRIFSYNSSTNVWTPKGNFITNNTAVSAFGDSIDITSDGSIIAIGISGMELPFMPVSGIVQIFKFENDSWNQLGDNINGMEGPENSGIDISLSSDGTRVAILNRYSFRVYKNEMNNWIQVGAEITTSGNNSGLGSIDISDNGQIVVIGEPDFSEDLIQQGRVRVFDYGSGSWLQIGNDILGGQIGYRTGYSVSISGNGQHIAFGELGTTTFSTDTGRTRIFKNIDNSWTQIGNSIFGEGEQDYSGNAVSISTDAATLAIGASRNNGNGSDSGHVRVYDLSSSLSLDNSQSSSETVLFPNPTTKTFLIRLHEGNMVKKVNIYSFTGQLIDSYYSNEINISELSSGLYYVEILTNKGKLIKQIIRQ